jgi:hypothetical protein
MAWGKLSHEKLEAENIASYVPTSLLPQYIYIFYRVFLLFPISYIYFGGVIVPRFIIVI